MNSRDVSQKPVVLLLHGFFSNVDNWHACADVLSSRWRVLLPTLPFFGVRQNGDHLAHVHEFLLKLLAREKVGQVVAIGNSLGGQLAVNLAVRAPEKIAGLVLAGCSGLYERNLTNKVQRHPGRAWLRARMAEIFFDEAHITEKMVDEVHAIIHDRQKVVDVVRLAKIIRKTSARELLPQIRCPVLLIWGEDDKITPPATAREFQSLLPKSELHFLPRCGHAAMMEHPEKFCRLVENFLERIAFTT